SARLLDLLERWQSLQQQGQTTEVAEVCADCPELAGDLERLARFVRQVETLAADPTVQDTDAPPGPATLPTLRPPHAAAGPGPATPAEQRYAVEGKLGEGGMGTVYRAHDRLLRRTVALKMIRVEAMSPGMRARFEAEARAVAWLDHPHIVKVFDV